MQANFVVELYNLVLAYAQRWPVIPVKAAVVRDDGVQAVVAPRREDSTAKTLSFLVETMKFASV